MSSVPPPTVSPMLLEAAELRFDELNRAKSALHSRYDEIAGYKAAGDNTLKRVEALLEQVNTLDPYLQHNDDLPILTRYVEQAKHDRSISEAKLLKFEKELFDKVTKHKNRLEVSSLHVELFKEALAAEDPAASAAAKLEKAALDDDFELVEDTQLADDLAIFEQNTFTTKGVDIEAIEEYLNGLFEGDLAKEQLQRVCNEMAIWGNDVMNGDELVEEELMSWCISDLLANGLLNEEKKKTLQGYLQSPSAVRELMSTLNMKSIRHWNWRNPEKGLNVTARQNSDGKYCMTVDEEIVDMLFLHTSAVGWGMKLRESLNEAIAYKSVWPGNKLLTSDELDKRTYYLLATPPKSDSCSTCHPPPPPPPPPPMIVDVLPPPRRRGGPLPPPPPPPPPMPMPPIKRKGRNSMPPPPPLPRPGTPNLNDERYRAWVHDFFVSQLPKRFGASPEGRSMEQTQAILMKTLAVETRINEELHGSAHGLVANFKSFASSLSHATVLTVLKFLGVPQLWLDVFARFLAAPLNRGPMVRGKPDQVATRLNGVPIAHGLEAFFGEAILHFLDQAVHRKTGLYLYRVRDKCYFVGTASQRDAACEELDKFANIMGLDIECTNRMTNVPIGFLNFNIPEDGEAKATFTIDNQKVTNYAHRIKKQLAACPSVISWIRTWNATVGSYAIHRFGSLANVYGIAHLTAVTEAYNTIHSIIFPNSSLTQHITNLLTTHLGHTLSDPPFSMEALIYLPNPYGGLGVKNVYTTLSLAASCLPDEPLEPLTNYIAAEHKYYDRAAASFAALTPTQITTKQKRLFHNDEALMARVLGPNTQACLPPTTFPSFEELTSTRYRAAYPILPPPPFPQPAIFPNLPDLLPVYQLLMGEPCDPLPGTDRVMDEVARVAGRGGMKRWWNLTPEQRWVLEMYADECFEVYGGLEVWHGPSVPLGALECVWGSEAGLGDEEGSVTSLTEV